MSAPKKSKPSKATADLEATGFAVDQIRQTLGCAPDEDVLDKARRRMEELDNAIAAHHAYESEYAQAFRALTLLLGKYGMQVGDVEKLHDLTDRLSAALAALDERIEEACEILDIPEGNRGVEAMLTNLRQKYAGLERQNEYLRREILDAKRILGIDDPHGMLLDEQGHVMGDIMDAWAETKRVLLVNQYPIPDSLPEACRSLAALVKELDERIDSALGNLALHTSATEIEDAAAEVSGKLEDAETRLEALENERLQQLADAPADEGEAMRIVLELMRRVVTGKLSITHHV